MTPERRRYPRVAKPLDGSWRGASGVSACRIADIGWGGCFIQTLAEPKSGEHTIVTLPIGDGHVEIEGAVVYVERGMGFAVQFGAMTDAQVAAITTLLGERPAETPIR